MNALGGHSLSITQLQEALLAANRERDRCVVPRLPWLGVYGDIALQVAPQCRNCHAEIQ